MEWIPVTTRLPAHGVDVLVTLAPVRKGAKSKVAIGTRWDADGPSHCGVAGWSVNDDDIKTPLSWMALPLPFNHTSPIKRPDHQL